MIRAFFFFFFFQTFRNRLVEVIDQAQHFAALGHAGGGGQTGDVALAFREGLEVTERERKSPIMIVSDTGCMQRRDEKYSHSRRKAQRRPNNGTSVRIGYVDDGIRYRVGCLFGCCQSVFDV